MNVTKDMTHIIMGALSVADGEGQDGLNVNDSKDIQMSDTDWRIAIDSLVGQLYKEFPEVIERYSWVYPVEKIIKETNV